MRPIDGDYISDALEAELCREGDDLEDRQWAYGYAAGVSFAVRKLAEAPTLTPPNDPLTLEELRKMDGEPAWWDDGEGSCWGIISVDSAGMWGGIPFLRGRWRQVNFEYNIEERKMRIYRRPPEGEEDGNV